MRIYSQPNNQNYSPKVEMQIMKSFQIVRLLVLILPLLLDELFRNHTQNESNVAKALKLWSLTKISDGVTRHQKLFKLQK